MVNCPVFVLVNVLLCFHFLFHFVSPVLVFFLTSLSLSFCSFCRVHHVFFLFFVFFLRQSSFLIVVVLLFFPFILFLLLLYYHLLLFLLHRATRGPRCGGGAAGPGGATGLSAAGREAGGREAGPSPPQPTGYRQGPWIALHHALTPQEPYHRSPLASYCRFFLVPTS